MRRFGKAGWLCGLTWLATSMSGCVLISGNLNPFSSTPQPLQEQEVGGKGDAKILLLDISNVITDQEEQGPFGVSVRPGMTSRVREELEKAADDDRVKGVLLRINSPGGTVTASDIIYHELMRFKEEHRLPVVAHMMDMGTSGAYYIALAADQIVASPTTVTGSVGVIMAGVNFSGLMEKLGVKNQTFKAGKHKDIASPLRPLTAADEQLMQSVLDDMHQRFLGLVRERRSAMNADALQTISDGRIVTAAQALQAGLVDQIGYADDAIRLLKQRAGIGDARIILYRRPNEYAENIYSRTSVGPPQVNLVNFDLGSLARSPQFMYMWLPGAESAADLPGLH
ncbi:MAG: signal peptide peptidase SppA [Deltaproteobacteria bacterium]|nr:signal peptide peptidase SppA [Deltaproteobacteria bacterium]